MAATVLLIKRVDLHILNSRTQPPALFMISTSDLPAVNAFLNTLSAFFISIGYLAIRRKWIGVHRASMIAGFSASTVFLISYLTYHVLHGSTDYAGEGWHRLIYFIILVSHTILAAVVVPLVLITLYRALGQQFDRHKRIARWTFPIWLYVSITGVVVYLMLYQFS